MSKDNKIPDLYYTDWIPFDEKPIRQVWYHPKVNFVWCIAELDMQTGKDRPDGNNCSFTMPGMHQNWRKHNPEKHLRYIRSD